jgi:DNA polymerase III subunit beta
MKLKCHRPSLATAFQVVSGVVPSRTTKDILKNVKLQVEGGKATLIGTDSEVGVRYEIPQIETDSAGETLLPTNRIVSILRELQDESVEIEVSEDAVWIRSAHSQFRLSASDPAEFPPVAAFEDEPSFVLPGGTLKQMIHRTIFATDVESTRYALGGVLVDLEPERITMAATDTRRLAMVEYVGDSPGLKDVANRNPVIPSKAMVLIERSIEDDKEDVAVAVYPNHVLVKTGRSTIYSRLVEGRFPRYRDVIPNQPRSTIELVVAPFHSAIRQAQIVTNEESRGVDFQFANGMLTLNSQAADVGQSTIELPISYDGEDLTITFDPRFIGEFLRVLDAGASVRLELIDPESAAVLRTDDAYTYVIMPLSRER